MDDDLLPPGTTISTSGGIEPYYDWCEPHPVDCPPAPTTEEILAWVIGLHCGGVLHLDAEIMAECRRRKLNKERGAREWVYRAVTSQGQS